MNWELKFLPEVEKDFRQLSGDQRILVRKAIKKVQTNPLPMNEGGYGKPLGNKGGTDLTGFLKIKLRGSGLRVVYKLVRTESEMLIVIVGARADDEVYETAEQRVKRYSL
jgi:mRNA interferase RelE/StbE